MCDVIVQHGQMSCSMTLTVQKTIETRETNEDVIHKTQVGYINFNKCCMRSFHRGQTHTSNLLVKKH